MRRFAAAAIIGTRPEAIKMAPVLRALSARGISTALVCTGQHADLDLPGCNLMQAADARFDLEARNLHADDMCDRIEALLRPWLLQNRPRLVVVQGDTNSALAGARAADWLRIPVVHVEAGLRTFDLADPWPEERNRVEIDRIAALLFAPTPAAVANLRRERVGGLVIESGNSGIDALLDVADGASPVVPIRPLILVTVHRRENRGAGVRSVGNALVQIAAQGDVTFAIPLHVNRQARQEMLEATAGLTGLCLLEPQSFAAMVTLMRQSRCILSDSGGLQEEAPALGRPLLILRSSTERPEAIASGSALLVGTDPAIIARETLRLLYDDAAHAAMSRPAFPFGQGGAAPIIADQVVRFLD
ncbi:MAG TPA: UDP-N-acetylglucosamine 2-epimerase (non-hydrolyzing) [Sphingomonadaceae bacterium]|nr:UDP-N-acetylglucosamine 2-epimerase (non-hydrolyzing) [Sphingomonadaceae bacterium]